MKDRRSKILLSKWNAMLASLLLPPTYANINMFADSQNVGTISINVDSLVLNLPAGVVCDANMGTTLFDDAIHEFPIDADKPQFIMQ